MRNWPFSFGVQANRKVRVCNAVNGQVPYYFHLELSITTPSSAPVSVEPSYLIYVGGLRALTYGDAVGGGPPPPGSGNGDVPVGSSSGLVWYLASTGSGGDAIPALLQAQLPGYTRPPFRNSRTHHPRLDGGRGDWHFVAASVGQPCSCGRAFKAAGGALAGARQRPATRRLTAAGSRGRVQALDQ
jgi:hypothetical protein